MTTSHTPEVQFKALTLEVPALLQRLDFQTSTSKKFFTTRSCRVDQFTFHISLPSFKKISTIFIHLLQN